MDKSFIYHDQLWEGVTPELSPKKCIKDFYTI